MKKEFLVAAVQSKIRNRQSAIQMTIGVLALQGDYEAHQKVMERVLGGRGTIAQVRTAEDLQGCDGLIIPGGESTTMARLCDRYDLWEPLKNRIEGGMGVLGTCAGLIMLAQNIEGATNNFAQRTLQVLDVDVTRNAYGAQLDSFETDIALEPTAEYSKPTAEYSESDTTSNQTTMRGVFIRAPRITRCGTDVKVLARYQNEPVAVRQGNIIASAFHPEVCGETRLHELWSRTLSSKV